MNKNELKYYKYKFEFKSPVKISSHKLVEKEIIILNYKALNGESYFGEISPLVGFSSETIDDCEEQLHNLKNLSDLIRSNDLRAIQNTYSSYPSLLFGIEQILYSIEVLDREITSQRKSIINNALIGIKDKDDTIADVKHLIDAGYNTIKLKIGRSDFSDDLSIMNILNEIYGNKVKFRLDNNSSWNIDEAKRNIERLTKFNIEYLEQPVENLDDLIDLQKNLDMQIVPDESIEDYNICKDLIESGNFRFIVLKPSIRLGLYNTLKLIDISKKMGVNLIISSAFETAIGRSTLSLLAAQTEHKYAHGLNVELLGNDIISSAVNYETPEILLSQSNPLSYTIKQI